MSHLLIKSIVRYVIAVATPVAVWLICACSPATNISDGGGTRGGNPVVTGSIAGLDGAAARNVRVQLIDENYNPVTDAPLQPSSIDTTNSRGEYTVIAPDSGWYNVEAMEMRGGTRLLRFHVWAQRDSCIVLPIDTLHKPGAISVSLPEGSSAAGGYVYVPGTGVSARLAGSTDSVTLDSVPAGTLPVLYYANKNSEARTTIRHDIPVYSGETTPVGNPQWSFCRRIVLNTSPTGAGVSDDVHDFPVLIRLNGNNFSFKQALPDGADLMFTGNNDAALAAEIERWDPVAELAEVWVKVDTISGDNADQSISMYWGNPAAPPRSSTGRVFDTADGYRGVWHLGDAGDDSVRDATVNRYHGTSPDTARPPIIEGVAGYCRRFNGSGDYITMPNTSGGRLNFPQDGSYTVCAWVRIDAFINDAPQLIVSKGYEQYFLRTTYFPSTTPSWEFTEFDEDTKWQSTRSPAGTGVWVLLTGVRQGAEQRLYRNGELVDSVKDVWYNKVSRDTTNDLSLGAFLRDAAVPNGDGRCFLKGAIDEVRIRGVAESAAWIRLCYMNQRIDDRLVEFR